MDERVEICKGRWGEGVGKGLDGGGRIGRIDHAQGVFHLSFSIECGADLVGYSDHWSTRYISFAEEKRVRSWLVGTGKSLILSLFFQLLPTPHKLRTHYHPFLLSLYRRVFQEMQKQKSGISNTDRTQAMEIAGKRGWRAVFAGGRWEGDEGDKGQVEEGMAYTIAKEMILEYHIL
jgi:hypothetical protein